MKTPAAMVISLLVSGAASCGSASQLGPRDAQIRQDQNLPCFSVVDASETRQTPPKIAALTVYERINGRQEPIWDVNYVSTSRPTFLSPQRCIRYGSADQGKVEVPAKRLAGGRPYTIEINSHIRNGDQWENRWYEGHFCLKEGKGDLQVHVVRWNDQMGELDWNTCGVGPQ